MTIASPPPADPGMRGRFPFLLACCALAAMAITFGTSVGDSDVWWHLSQGRALWNGEDPAAATASWSRPDGRVRYVPWLGDGLLYAAYRAGGAQGLVVLKVIAGVFWLWVLAFAARRRGTAAGPSFVVLGLVALLVQPRACMDRPYILAWGCMVGTMALLLPRPGEDDEADGRRGSGVRLQIAVSLLALVAWIHVHATFIVWFGVVGAAVGAAALARRWAEARTHGLLAIAGAVCAVALPTGRQGLHNVLAYRASPTVRAWTVEAQPFSLHDRALWVPLLVIMAAIVSMLGGIVVDILARRARPRTGASGRRQDELDGSRPSATTVVRPISIRATWLVPLLWSILGLLLLLQGPRWVGEGLLLATPALFVLAEQIARHCARHCARGGARGGDTLGRVAPALVAGLVLGAHMNIGPGLVVRSGAIEEDRWPNATLTALRRLTDLTGDRRVWNTMGLGGYLGFAGFDVFLDGRSVILYDEEFFVTEVLPVERDAEAFRQRVERTGVTTAVVAMNLPLEARIANSTAWKPVAFDACCTLLVHESRLDAAQAAGLQPYELFRFAADDAFLRRHLDTMSGDDDAERRLLAEVERLAGEAPDAGALAGFLRFVAVARPELHARLGPRAKLVDAVLRR